MELSKKTLAAFFLLTSVSALSTTACTAQQDDDSAGDEDAVKVDLDEIGKRGDIEIKAVTSAPASSPSAAIHPATMNRYRFSGGSPIKYWINNSPRTMGTDVTAPGSVTVASNESDKLFVFVADQGEAIRFRTIDSNGMFGPWQFMGHYAKITPTATMVAPNVMAAFMVGNDGRVYYRLINTIYGTLGKTALIPSITTKRPLGAAMLNGITYLFLVEDGTSRVDIAQLAYNYSTQTLSFTGPGGWLDYGISAKDVSAYHVPGTSLINVAAVDTSSYLRYRVIQGPTSLGGWAYDPAWAFVAGQPGLCGPDVYVRGLDGNIYEKVFGSTGAFIPPYN